MNKGRLLLLVGILLIPFLIYGKKDKEENTKNDTLKASTFSGLKFRSIGPAFTSGRIADFAVNPVNHSEYFVAVASGNIWKTTNSGTTFSPVFEKYGSYSIGCLAMDPNNSNVVWAGTGENNHQRSVSYGDGVYKTIDGGKSWKNMGLKDSRHIGKIIIHPGNSDIVFVAAEGSLWGPGGDRGLYKTTDGGKTWNKVLEISENTGINDMVMDPRDPDVIYASSEQRRRHHFTKIGGGPESDIYKTTDGGENWTKLKSGLPSGHVGGIGLAISPVNPDVIYAIIEAEGESGGFFRSQNRGASWKKMSDHHASGQYYNEIYCDPKDVDKVYSVETVSKVTEDAGKTWRSVGNNARHVDDHAMWINPDDTQHFLIGGDGGIYETFDGGKNYIFKSNLPVTQFYRVNVDNQYPFYHVYGGTQDNSSMGGPSQNLSSQGVPSSEWYVTNGGDGFWAAIDPVDNNIVYAEAQYGNMVRYDRKSGESISIRPEPRKGEDTYKWNWNTPLIISPHLHTRLYCAANKVFRSDDRGNSWKVISDDLTTGIDRNTWKVMDKYWSIDAVVKDVSTSLFGTIVAMDESRVKEDLLYIGTDDGLIQVTEDASTWKKVDQFPGVPQYTYVSDVFASRFDENIVFASFDNRKRDDFTPYILKSSDKGMTWESITGDLPEEGSVHSIIQDHINPDLLFAGTEFGIFFSYNGGKNWIQLKSGIPTISVKDIAIQERENDLVLATFGRGFYILHDYSPLRIVDKDFLENEGHIFDIKDALMYVQQRGRYGQGSTYFTADNPDFGAVFSYYIKEVPKTRKQIRKKEEKELFDKGEKIPIPSPEELKAEENEIAPYVIFTITDEEGDIVRKLYSKPSKGINRIVWNLRYEPSSLRLSNNKFNPLRSSGGSIMALPGNYAVSMSLYHDGEITELAGPVTFTAKVLDNRTLPTGDRQEIAAFNKKVNRLYKAMRGTQQAIDEMKERVEYIKQAIHNSPELSNDLLLNAHNLSVELDEMKYKMQGNTIRPSDEENPPGPVPLNQRLSTMIWASWRSSTLTETQKTAYDILSEEFPPLLERLHEMANNDIKGLEDELNRVEAPYTPGRLPVWNK